MRLTELKRRKEEEERREKRRIKTDRGRRRQELKDGSEGVNEMACGGEEGGKEGEGESGSPSISR